MKTALKRTYTRDATDDYLHDIRNTTDKKEQKIKLENAVKEYEIEGVTKSSIHAELKRRGLNTNTTKRKRN